MAVLFEGAMEEKKRNINTAIVGSGGMGMGQILARKVEDKIPEIMLRIQRRSSASRMSTGFRKNAIR